MVHRRVYLYYAGPPEHTKVFKLPDGASSTAPDLLAAFAEAYGAKHPGAPAIAGAQLALRTEGGAPVDAGRPIAEAIESGSTLTVVKAAPGGGESCSVTSLPRQLRGALAESRAPAAAASKAAAAAQATGRPHIERPKPARTAGGSTGASSAGGNVQDPALVRPFLEKAAEAEERQQYRMAATIYEQVLNSAPHNHEGLTRLASLWRKVGKPARALPHARTAVACRPGDAAARELLACCLRDAGETEEAMQAFDRAAALATRQGNQPLREQAQVGLAALLYATGEPRSKEAAAGLVMSVLEANEGQQAALLEYAAIAYDRGMVPDATRVLLRLLIARRDDTRVKLLLARCLAHAEGMALVREELSSSGGREAAFAFLATAVKDQGAVATCIELFTMAVEAAPQNASYALNLMHAHELLQDYGAAVAVALRFCRVTQLTLGGGFQFSTAAALLEGLPPLTKCTGTEWLRLEPWRPQTAPDYPTAADREAAAAAAAEPAPAPVTGQEAVAAAAAPGEPEQLEYRGEQLDALALLFTTVKVLFLGGAIARTDRLREAVQGARQASRRPLHTTLIRNEAAYFACIGQLLREHPPPPTPAHLRPLFLCGDSHTLSGAWHSLRLRGEARLIHPLLVTGCKVWHLRAAGRFFPKMAWRSTLEALPDGSQLVFMFGEIDCREGLLLAVSKLKYESMGDAMTVLADIYAGVLLELVTKRRFEIFVHPVPSVLNETRHVVQPFNEVLRATVARTASKPAARGRLHWLPHFPQLLTPDGLRLSPRLQFDGTHMNPGYVGLMEQAMADL